jgi:predicted ATPase
MMMMMQCRRYTSKTGKKVIGGGLGAYNDDVDIAKAKSRGPIAYYEALSSRGAIRHDAHQLKALAPLDELFAKQSECADANRERDIDNSKVSGTSFWSSMFSSFSNDDDTAVNRNGSSDSSRGGGGGVYMHGDVGCGKTFLMDMYYECCAVSPKRRVHFHQFMLDVHRRIHRWRRDVRTPSDSDPLVPLAAALAAEARVLCFDEFQVTDVADAMILLRIFKLLVNKHGVSMVATSNREPGELYKNGLNRHLFLPFIDFVHRRFSVYNLNSGIDYRLTSADAQAHGVRVYCEPLGDESRAALDRMFETLGHGEQPTPERVELDDGRTLHVPATAHGVARFTFSQLCAEALGAADYLALAKRYHTLVLDDVPRMSLSDKTEARRFITLVDALYEFKVKLICSADAPPADLFSGSDHNESGGQGDVHGITMHSGDEELFAFSRAVSRLIEMQSAEYLEAAHRAN